MHVTCVATIGQASIRGKGTDMGEPRTAAKPTETRGGSVGEVFLAFLKLGLTSFGGPIAHLGYFRDELVLRRGWLSETAYADLVALCQFLPGPASSQAGFALGYMRAGPMGAAAAWAAFTLPSALALFFFAVFSQSLQNPPGEGILHGLKIVAVIVVAQAVYGMARTLCPDRTRAAIGLLALVIVTLVGGGPGQIAAIACGGVLGWFLCRDIAKPQGRPVRLGVTLGTGLFALFLFAVLLVALPLFAVPGSPTLALIDTFYRAGALVFGGGHVVLPLLEAGTVESGWITEGAFLSGYGAAQAIPGPLFTFASYLGAAIAGPTGAILALLAIFAPGFLLLLGVAPFWDRLSALSQTRAAMAGTNAAVVGILAAALYDPLWTTAILNPADFALAATGFVLITLFRAPPWSIVLLCAAASGALVFI